MSKKDAACSARGCPPRSSKTAWTSIAFEPAPERSGQRLLFIGSFRHFPNIEAYRFFTEQVWPLLREQFPGLELTVVCGADPLTYWRAFADTPEPAPDPRIRLLGFVADVRPLYVEANLVIVPTTVSAGTNVKVLEAMAMERAVVSTPSGCAGLGLLHGHSVWVGETPAGFRRRHRHPDRRSRAPPPDRAGRPRPRPPQFRLGRHRRKTTAASARIANPPSPWRFAHPALACRADWYFLSPRRSFR